MMSTSGAYGQAGLGRVGCYREWWSLPTRPDSDAGIVNRRKWRPVRAELHSVRPRSGPVCSNALSPSRGHPICGRFVAVGNVNLLFTPVPPLVHL